MSIVSGYAGDDGFRAPAEWDIHEQTWMGFPQVLFFVVDNEIETRYLERQCCTSSESIC